MLTCGPCTCRVLLAALLAALGGRAAAADWPHWRGAARNGQSTEDSGWTRGAWPPRQPLWTARVGEGATSPLVIGGRLYVMGWRDGRDHLFCLDAASGETVWEQSYPCPRYGRQSTGDEGLYSGVTATPEYDDHSGLLYTLSSDGDLNCWNTAQAGAHVWGLNLYERYGVEQRPRIGRSGRRDYGYTTSPLVQGGELLVEVGDDEGNLMAFDPRSGQRRWASECKDPAGHSGGLVPLAVSRVPCVAVLTLYGLLVTRLDKSRRGETLARYEWTTEFGNNIATPAVLGSSLLVTSGYNHHSIARLDVSLSGVRKVWEQPYASKVCSPLVYEGRVYWAWQQLHCLDWKTGELRWQGGQFGDAGSCVATADGRLLIWGGQGELVLAETAARSPGEYTELARTGRLAASHAWPHVVLSNGRVYCKDRAGNLVCLSLAAP